MTREEIEAAAAVLSEDACDGILCDHEGCACWLQATAALAAAEKVRSDPEQWRDALSAMLNNARRKGFIAGRDAAEKAVQKVVDATSRQECCGHGKTVTPDYQECCGQPDEWIKEADALAAIRALEPPK